MENKTIENDYLQKEWADLEKEVKKLSFFRKIFIALFLASFIILSFLFIFLYLSPLYFLSTYIGISVKIFVWLLTISLCSYLFLPFRIDLLEKPTYKNLTKYQELHQLYNKDYKNSYFVNQEMITSIGRELAKAEDFINKDASTNPKLYVYFGFIGIVFIVSSYQELRTHEIVTSKTYNKSYLLADSVPWQDEAIKRKMFKVEKEMAKIKEIYYASQKLTMIRTYQLKKEIYEMQNLIDSLKQENLVAKLAQEKLITQLQQQNDSLAKQNMLLLKRLDSLKTTEK
jgi:hypothetical protein